MKISGEIKIKKLINIILIEVYVLVFINACVRTLVGESNIESRKNVVCIKYYHFIKIFLIILFLKRSTDAHIYDI